MGLGWPGKMCKCVRIAFRLGSHSGLLAAALLFSSAPSGAQTVCGPTRSFSLCEIVFDLSGAELMANAHPYQTVDIKAEFRSPRHRTFLLPAFWDGGRRMIVRFAPTEPGGWDFRITSNLSSFDGKTGQFSATDSQAPGFVRAANIHHFAYTGGDGNTPHLWMGDTLMRAALVDDASFRPFVDARASQKFTHIRVCATGSAEDIAMAFPTPEAPNPAYFQKLDDRLGYINQKGMTVDLVLAGG